MVKIVWLPISWRLYLTVVDSVLPGKVISERFASIKSGFCKGLSFNTSLFSAVVRISLTNHHPSIETGCGLHADISTTRHNMITWICFNLKIDQLRNRQIVYDKSKPKGPKTSFSDTSPSEEYAVVAIIQPESTALPGLYPMSVCIPPKLFCQKISEPCANNSFIKMLFSVLCK